MTKQEYIERVNKIAFMIHESYTCPERWNNHLFIMELSPPSAGLSNYLELERYGEITTILGDTFQYKFNSAKIINGKVVYGNPKERSNSYAI